MIITIAIPLGIRNRAKNFSKGLQMIAINDAKTKGTIISLANLIPANTTNKAAKITRLLFKPEREDTKLP